MKRILALSIFCLISSARADLTNGLLAYYPFTGNANDASGNGHNGVVNGASLTHDRFGNPNSAYSFNGTNSYISAVFSNLPSGYSPRTMTAWVMPTRAIVNDAMLGAIGYGVGNYRTLFGLGIYHTQKVFCWGGYADFSPPLSVPVNTWSFVVITYSTNTVGISVNGVAYESDGYALDTINNGKLFFGVTALDGSQPSWPAGNWDKWFCGGIDDVRIYNRALLTDEVAQLYDLEAPPHMDLIKAVKPSFSHIYVGTNYQLQVSADLTTWTNQGVAFTATNRNMVYPQYWDVDSWGKLFFRLQVVP